MHARGNDDVDNKTSDDMTRKWGTVQTEQPLIPEHHGYSPKFKSLLDLTIKFEAKVSKEVVDDTGLSVSLSLHHVLNLSDPLHQ
jgi:hypothetical protein